MVDWVVEESFAGIPAMHPGVNRVIPVAIRRWRINLLSAGVRSEMKTFREELASTSYDFVLDTQGLIKSALIARCATGTRCGYAWDSAREPLASLFYNRTFHVETGLHAVERNRLLAAHALNYQPAHQLDYGLRSPAAQLPWLPAKPYVVLLHATSRADKQWHDANWLTLGQYFNSIGTACILPWGNEAEFADSQRLAKGIASSVIPPRLQLTEMANLLAGARIVVGVDTGISHLAAALNVPVIALFCASDPALTGVCSSGPAVNLGSNGAPPAVAQVVSTIEKLLAT